VAYDLSCALRHIHSFKWVLEKSLFSQILNFLKTDYILPD
jgi:hypothetical protein